MSNKSSSKKGVQNPHDKLFKVTFSDPADAGSFLRAYLPDELVQSLDWTTLEFVDFGFLDDALKESESDILFKIRTLDPNGEGQEILLYLLFEHQSSPDKWMRFRLLKYKTRIWDELFKEKPYPESLVPIIPIVFYQGEESWPYDTWMSTLFPDDEETDLSAYQDFIPEFRHILVDHSGIGLGEIRGSVKARITQLLMWAAYHQPIQEALDIAAGLLAQLPRTGGLNYANIYVTYVSSTQDSETADYFVDEANKQASGSGGDMITAIEEWRHEGFVKGESIGEIRGELRGELKAQIAMIENFLRTNINWEIITKATRIDQTLYQFMKDIYAGIFIEPTPEADEIEGEQEYLKNRRVMIVKVLHYRFQLSDGQQSKLYKHLEFVDDKDGVNQLIDNALLVENLSLFYAELLDFLHAEPPAEKISQE